MAKGRMQVEMDADEQKLWMSMRRILRVQEQTERGFKDMGDAADRMGNKGQEAGRKITRGLRPIRQESAGIKDGIGKWVAGLATVGTASRGLLRIWTDIKQTTEEAMQAIREAGESSLMQAQLYTTRAERDRLTQVSKQLFASGAVPTMQAGRQAASQISSAGLINEPGVGELFGRYGPVVGSAEQMAPAIDAMRRNYPGKTPQQYVEMAMAGSAGNPAMMHRYFIAAAQQAAPAAEMGVPLPAFLGEAAVVAAASASPEIGATRVGALALTRGAGLQPYKDPITGQEYAGVPPEAFQSTTLTGYAAELRALNIPPAVLKKQLGRKEAFFAYSVLSKEANAQQARQLTDNIRNAENADTLESRLQIALEEQGNRAFLEERQAKAAREIALEDTAARQMRAETAGVRFETQQVTRDPSIGGRTIGTLGRWAAGAAGWLGAEQETAAATAEATAGALGGTFQAAGAGAGTGGVFFSFSPGPAAQSEELRKVVHGTTLSAPDRDK